MALTKEDLQAIGALMDSKLEPINARLDKVDIRLDKVDSRLNNIEDMQGSLSADMARLNHTIEPQLKIIMEGLDGLHERYRTLDRVEATQERHSERIWALEEAVRAR